MEQQNQGLRAALVAVVKELTEPATMGKLGLGAWGTTELLKYAKGLTDKTLWVRLGEVMLEMYVGPPDVAMLDRLAAATGKTRQELFDIARADELTALLAEHGVNLAELESQPLMDIDRANSIEAARQLSEVPMPWEGIDDKIDRQAKPLADLDPLDDSVVRAIQAVRNWVLGRGKPLLTITGVPGSGKTTMLQAAGRMLVAGGAAAIYRVEGDLFGDISTGMTTNRVEPVYQAFATVPYLLWDDFGRHADSAYKKGVVDRLVDDRYRGRLHTLIASNLKGDQLIGMERATSRMRDVEISESIGLTVGDQRLVAHG